MQPLAFLVTRVEDRDVSLTSCPKDAISAEAWDEFAACVAREPTLVSYPGCVFRARWERATRRSGCTMAASSAIPAWCWSTAEHFGRISPSPGIS